MRILHLAGEPEDVGGVLTVIRNLQTASRLWNWTHTVCVQRGYREFRKPSLEYWFSEHVRSDLPNHFLLFVQALKTFFELRSKLRDEHFDILHAHSRGTFLLGLMIASWLRRPVVNTIHAYSRRVTMFRWARRVQHFYTVLLTPNMARYYGLAETHPKVSVVSECCADDLFDRPLVGRRDPSDKRPIRLAGLGNIMRWKSWDLVAQAMARLPPEHRGKLVFSLWGPTPNDPDSQSYAAEVRQLVHRLKLEEQFLFCGVTFSVSDCLKEADWFLLPSTNEPCSVALIEALALGLPALVSASGGNIDIIQPNKTGLLFEPGNADDLAAKLQNIIQFEAELVPPEEVRASVKARSASEVAREYRKVYEAALRMSQMRMAP